MADNENNRNHQNIEDDKDFRPIIPEPELHRRPIIGFKKNYPVEENPTSTHTESFAQQEFKRKVKMGIAYTILLLITFAVAFVITDTCIKISTEPLPETTAAELTDTITTELSTLS